MTTKRCTSFRGATGLLLGLTLGLGACEMDTLTAEEHDALASMRLPASLPPSPGNKVADDPEAAALGQQFFFDARFSGKLLEDSDLGTAGTAHKVACATCHDPSEGGADRRQVGGTSLAAGWTGRNSLAVVNAAHSPWMFWDGRRDSMWSQALAPIEEASEHNTTRLDVVHTLYRHYRGSYEKVFGPLPPMDDTNRFPLDGRPGMAAFDGMAADDRVLVNRAFANFGKALEAYQRRLVDHSSPFDRYMAGDRLAISDAAVRGAKLFVGRAACNECHSGPMLADGKFHNHGVPQVGSKVPRLDPGRKVGLERLLADEFNAGSIYAEVARPELLTSLRPKDGDLGAFKTPTLRNVGKTGPYMHTGNFDSLWDIVEWYNDAAGTDGFSGTRAAASVVPLRLSREDIDDLVQFLLTLDGDPLPDELVRKPVLP